MTPSQKAAGDAASDLLNNRPLPQSAAEIYDLLTVAFYHGCEYGRMNPLNPPPKIVQLESLIAGHIEAMRPLVAEWSKLMDEAKAELKK